MAQFKYWVHFSPIPHSSIIFFDNSINHVLKFLTIYKVLIIQNIKISFTFYG